MNTGYFLYINSGDILLAAQGVTWWVELLIMALILLVAFFIFRSRLNALRHTNADLERQLLEKSELLTYSRKNEQKTREIAEMANTNKSQLLSKISHEIRTPMNAVLGMASLLNQTPLNTEQQEYVGSILYSGDSLLTIINEILMEDVLEYSKVESGKELQQKDFDIRDNIEEVLDVFASKAAQSNIDLLCDIDKNVPPQVVSDSMRLRQVLMNIIENSIKFTDSGEIFVGVHLAEQTDDNKVKLEFEIRDTGRGISPSKVEELARDLSVKNKILDNSSAAGVGLLVSKNLVALMGGVIKIESRENVGTTVRFTINAGISLQSLRSAPVNDLAGLEGKKILLVDDNATSRQLLKNQLEKWPLLISTVGSGEEALQLLSQNSFDLVIVDQQMPKMSGIACALEVRKSNATTPVILLNRVGDEEYKQHATLFNSVLHKPVHLQALVEQIISALRQKGKTGEQTNARTLSADFAKEYPLSILIAEDNAMNQKLVSRVLSKLGYEAHITNNGKEVLEEVSQKHYDVILMDVQMPEMDGLEATRMIRLCLNTQPVIIAMTANTLQGDREECLRSGMDDYISKPVKLEELVNLLEKWAIHKQRA